MTSRALAVLESGAEDLYYNDINNSKVQALPVEYNTRFTYDFSNKTQGTSVFLLPPGNGYRVPVIVIGWNASTLAGNTGFYALPRGWGYSAVARISFRVAGSTQFYWSGLQLLQRNLRMVRTSTQADQILSLGGNAVATSSDWSRDQFAYIPLTCWSGPSVDGISLPLPGDILSQNVQISVELNPPSSYFITNSNPGAATGSIPSAFDVAYLQAEQLVLSDKAQSLANDADFAEGRVSYSMPVLFDQQEVVISNLNATTASQPVVLSGFRSGEVKSIECFLVDRTANTNLNWKKPTEVSVIYAGVIYSQYNNGVSALFNLIDGTKGSVVNTVQLSAPASPGTMSATNITAEWVSLPFGQRSGADYSDDVHSHGKEILNGIVNLQISLPDAGTSGGSSKYDLHIIYTYVSLINFSRGTAEWVF